MLFVPAFLEAGRIEEHGAIHDGPFARILGV
jgi:hypothetical protein